MPTQAKEVSKGYPIAQSEDLGAELGRYNPSSALINGLEISLHLNDFNHSDLPLHSFTAI